MDIKKIQSATNLSQAALAATSGIDRTRIGFLENGYVQLTPEQSAIRHVVRDLKWKMQLQRSLLEEYGSAV